MIRLLAGLGVLFDARPAAFGSVWRAAGVSEAVEGEDATEAEPYATRSPRSTRGATRA